MDESLQPTSFGVKETVETNPRKITIEEAIARQLDRIAYQRSVGEDWSESVFALRDMIHGQEDAEFWTGLSEEDRTRLATMTPYEADLFRKKRAVHGWDGMPMNRTPAGEWVPTTEQLSWALRIILKLLSRRGMTWRTRHSSHIHQH